MSAIRCWLVTMALALLSACGGGGSGADDNAVTPARAGAADIGPSGGSVDAVLEGGATVRLDIPQGAVASTTTFHIDPAVPSSGTLGAFELAPADVTLRAPATLTVTLPAGATLDPDATLAFDTVDGLIPFSTTLDPAARTLTVQLASTPASPIVQPTSSASERAQALASGPATGRSTRISLVNLTYSERLTLLESLVNRLLREGTSANAQDVKTVMNFLLRDSRAPAEPRVHTAVSRWASVVCAQQQFSVNALDTFAGTDIPTFRQLAKDVLAWDRNALDLNGSARRLTPAEPGCANVPADIVEPVRTRLPAFLTAVSADLDRLDPNADADFLLLFQTRSAQLFSLAADFAVIGAEDLQRATNRVVTGQLDRARNLAYSTCRTLRDQKLQAKLLEILQTDPLLIAAASFAPANLRSDVQFCGMPLHWKVVNAAGGVLQQGDAGGVGPGFNTTAATLTLAGAAKLVVSGPLAALICPTGSQNNEQLVFSAGPLAGASSSVQPLTPSATNQYLQSSTLDFDLATLRSQGAQKLVVARQGGVCAGQFAGLTDHDTIVTFTLSTASAAMTIEPRAPALRPGEQVQFVALLDGQPTTAVTWSAVSGTISTTGLYTAPQTSASATVTAISVGNPTQRASTTVTVSGTTLAPFQRDFFVGTCSTVSALADVFVLSGTLPVTEPLVNFTVQGDATLANPRNFQGTGGIEASIQVFAGPSTSGQVVVTATSIENPNAAVNITFQIDPILGTGGVFNDPAFSPGHYQITRGGTPPNEVYGVDLQIGNSISGHFQFSIPLSAGGFSATNFDGGSVTGSVSATGITGSFSDASSTRSFDLRRIRRGGC